MVIGWLDIGMGDIEIILNKIREESNNNFQNMSGFRPEYSIQSLLNMNIEENIYRRCIDEVKSPLQTFNLSNTTIDSNSKLFQNNQHAFSTLSSFNQVNGNIQYSKRSVSRTRKRIFDQSPKVKRNIPIPAKHQRVDNIQYSGNMKSINQNSNMQSLDLMKNGSEVGCWDMCMNTLIPTKQTILDEIQTSRSQQITIKEYSPLNYRHSPPPLEKLHYQNLSIPPAQSQFIAFILKIIPKLYLRNSLASHLFVNKSQLLQSLLTQPYKYQRQQAINNIFSGKMNRIDRRFNSPNVNQLINKITLTSNKPVDSYAQEQVVETVRRIVDLLNEVEEDIKEYLGVDSRVRELGLIYEQMMQGNIGSKPLSVILYQYLNRKGVSCRESNVEILSYIWEGISSKCYSREEFIDEIIKNDIIVKRMSDSEGELEKELMKMGYTRNS